MLEASALLPDIATFANGVDTEIGEKGITLSGGQKARVSFARTLYRDADITLLDDPLSAVDAHTCEHLWTEGVKGALRGNERKKTVLIVTHQIHLLSDCDLLVILDKNGTIRRVCKYNELATSELDELFHENSAIANDDSDLPESNTNKSEDCRKRSASRVRSASVDMDKNDSVKVSKVQDTKLMQDEDRKVGIVPFSVYVWFCRSGGLQYIGLMALLIFIGRAINVFATFYLSYWGAKNAQSSLSEESNVKYLHTYAWIVLTGVGISAVKNITSTRHAVQAGRNLHNQMLQRVLRAPINFFDTTPLGRVLNRFTTDIQTSDMGLSAFLGILFSLCADLTYALVAVSITTRGILLIILVPIALLYYRIQLYYRKSNTEIRRLESISRSPVFTEISQSLSGITSIRAFESTRMFVERLNAKMNKYSSIYFVKQKLSSWISMRIEFLGALISFCVVLLAVVGKGIVPPSALAVSLTYCFTIPLYLGLIMSMGAEAEAQMSSVERIKYFSDEVPLEEDVDKSSCDLVQVASTWPEFGRIEAVEIKMRYRDGPMVLNGITFNIEGSERVGIAGRTGSGKSSLLVALFRMEKLESGHIYIDGVDISKIPLFTLRSRLSIIPQDPTVS